MEQSNNKSQDHVWARQGRASRAMSPRAPGSHHLTPASAGTSRGHAAHTATVPRCISPRMPLLLFTHPSSEHAKADRHWAAARCRFFFNFIHSSSTQQPGHHICSLTINLSITACPHPNQPQGMRDLQKREPYADAPGVFFKGIVYHTCKMLRYFQNCFVRPSFLASMSCVETKGSL